MGPLIARRLIELPIAIVVILLIVFVALMSTGDPIEMMAPPEATEEDRQQLREAYGLDKSLPHQFVLFLGRAVQGDFGDSLFQSEPAFSLVMERLPASLKLAGASVAIAATVGIPLGIIAALKRGGIIDVIAMTIALLGQSIANFWLALMLILVFAVTLGWFPVSGQSDGLRSLVLPASALSVWLLALLARMARSGMLEIMGEDFIRTARAKGVKERMILIRHALRHVLAPLITLISLSLGWQLGGAVVIESIFAWQGLGSLLLESVLLRDFPVVLAGVTVLATTFIALNLITDILYPVIDPRMRQRGAD